jgi:hypothetical protein
MIKTQTDVRSDIINPLKTNTILLLFFWKDIVLFELSQLHFYRVLVTLKYT